MKKMMKIEKDNVQNILPLTNLQQGMLFYYINNPKSKEYHEQLSLTFEGEIKNEIIKKAWEHVIKSNEMLRTVYMWDELEKPIQIVLKKSNLNLKEYDLTSQTNDEKIKMLNEIRKNDLEETIDITTQPLRILICNLEKNKCEMIISSHHIIYDGWSNGIILKEFIYAYNSYFNEKEPGIPVKTKFQEFIKWDINQDKTKQKEYWTNYLQGVENVNRLSINKENDSKDMKIIKEEFSKALTDKLVEYSKEHKVALSAMLYSMWGIVLQKYNNSNDAVFGTTVSGRKAKIKGIEDMIGLFINSIPLRIKNDYNSNILDVIANTEKMLIEREEFENTALTDIKSYTDLRGEEQIFDSLVVIENYPIDKNMHKDSKINIEAYSIAEMTNYDITLNIMLFDNIELNLNFNNCKYNEEFMKKIIKSFISIAETIVSKDSLSLSEICLVTDEEEKKLLYNFNDTKAEYPSDKTIHELFEEQVERTPDNIAIIYEDEKLTYVQLNERANKLARVLRSNGVKADTIVGIMIQRSLEMVVGIMAILKAGGAYLPIDSKYPSDRINYILDDSQTNILLTNKEIINKRELNYKGKIIDLNDECKHISKENLEKINSSKDLAYIIYTSGSTGKPKGALIQHNSLVNRLNWMQKNYPIGKDDTILQKTTYTFDVSVWELLWWSIVGAKVCMLKPNGEKDVEEIVRAVNKYKITTMHFVPSMLDLFIDYMANNEENMESLRQVFSSGEALKPNQVITFNKFISSKNGCKLINLYGPTEASIDVTYFNCLNKEYKNIPIGRPIDNIRLYIIDNNNNKIQPIGVPGELCISGIGLARGYLNKPEMTAQKFIANPFESGEKMYKTGDLARWLPDGNIEFLGRIDYQVKIRGFRIELGEIENVLLKHEELKEVVIIDKIDKNGSKYLCAYIVSDKEQNIGELKKYLSDKLPDYMVPAHFMQLQEMPLTPNGKINRKALPEPDVSLNTGVEYEEARNEHEKKIVEIWKEVLGVNKIGIRDNFFDLGGDSIKAIRLISKMKKYGYKLEIKELFKYPNIKDISNKFVFSDKEQKVSQELVTGSIELIPIQKWFFENNFTDMHYWNQAVMLFRKQGFDKNILEKVFNKIVEHHDALRIIYKKQNDKIVQYNRGVEQNLFTLTEFDYTNKINFIEDIQEECNKLQGSIDLSKGPLVKLGLFKTKDGDHLLIAIHHLVIDGVSWRILFEDFSIGYNQILNNEDIQFQEKSNSYADWAKAIKKYANNKELSKEVEYWEKLQENDVKSITKDNIIGEDKKILKYCKDVTVSLSKEYTKDLIKHVNRAYNTEINDILLVSLGLTIKKWCGENKVLINLEGHGRENIIDNVDISRTVGWFTTQYPVILDMSSIEDIGYEIKNIKEILRRIPNKGIGFGILEYISDRKIENNIKPEISFNYLGQFDEDLKNDIFEMSSVTPGISVSQNSQNLYALNINGMIKEGKLNMTFTYNECQFNEKTIIKISELYKEILCQIIEHCKGQKEVQVTPTDLGDSTLTLEELDVILKKYEGDKKLKIKNIYPLTPMQEGMLFHDLMDKNSTAYFEQTILTIKGDINLEVFKYSFDKLIERYDVLRTGFIHSEAKAPKQIVYKQRNANIHYEDLSSLKDDEKNVLLEDFIIKDRNNKFNLSEDLLMRISILRVKDKEYKVFWDFHHILMDGWCLSIIMNDFLKIYDAFKNNKTLELPEVYPYINYINWLKTKDTEEAAEYWKKYLQNYENKVVVPAQYNHFKEDRYDKKELNFKIGKELTKALNEIGKTQHVTVNTLIQTIWGILLQRYNNTNDVVFGSIVSGRNAELENIESMVGLFINTIPVRVESENDIDFTQLVQKMQANALLSSKYDYHSLPEIQINTEMKQELITNIIAFENYHIESGIINDKNFSKNIGFDIKHTNSFEQSNYGFNIIIVPGTDMDVKFSYNGFIYDEKFIESISNHFLNVIKTIIDNPKIKLSEIDIVTESEKDLLLKDFYNKNLEYVNNETIQQLFENQVELTPNNIAVTIGDKNITYKELNNKSNQLARLLRNKGIKQESIVGIVTKRSIEMIIGIMGTLKSGAAYLPIDPEYPKSRIEYMLEDSNTKCILTQEEFIDQFNSRCEIVNLEDKEIYNENSRNLQVINQGNDLAYVIYTSGTTGKPKGVMIEHRTIVEKLYWRKSEYRLTESDVVLPLVNYVFDGFITSFFTPIISGSRVVLASSEEIKNPFEIVKCIESESITHYVSVPLIYSTVLDLMNKENSKSLKVVTLAGEKMPLKVIEDTKKINKNIEIVNEYGPTENSVITTIMRDVQNDNRLLIGKPVANTGIYILNKNNKLQPIGVPGELCIIGNGLARGYLNRPDLTAEKFIQNPFESEGRMYKTGDLARMLQDGSIEFLGRIDNQVKIRGLRIELGEIENQIISHKLVKEAIVVDKNDKDNNKFLCAYIVSEKECEISELREYLAKELPSYMIPSYFIQIPEIPLTYNGKIDRHALPEPDISVGSKTKYEAPRNEIEEKLVKIWGEVLGKDKVGINDNFFDLGGHSLKATILATRIHKELNIEISIKEIFKDPTIKGISLYISKSEENIYNSIDKADEQKYYPVSSAQKRIYTLQQFELENTVYNMPAILELEGNVEKNKLEKVFKKLVERHESLRTSFHTIDEDTLQVIHDDVDFEVNYIDNLEDKIEDVVKNFIKPFDLSKAPLLRVALVKITNSKYQLMIDMHHIISDGTSIGILTKEFTELYQEKELIPLRLQYKDYAVWQNKLIESEKNKSEEQYWINRFSGEIPVVNMPYDYERPLIQNFTGDTINFEIDERMTQGLQKLSQKTNTTTYMILLSAYNILLSKYSGCEDIIVGSPIAGRIHADLENIIGMFVNSLPMRNVLKGEKTYLEFLMDVKENSLRAYENQNYQFEELVDKLDLRRDISRNPLFDFMFVVQNTSLEQIEMNGIKVKICEFDNKISKFDLTLNAIETGKNIKFKLEYCTQLFSKETIERIAEHYRNILNIIIENSEVKLSEIDIITEAEKEKLLYKFNDAKSEYPKCKTIKKLFEENVEKFPNNIALVFEDKQLTYRQLNERTNQVARMLRNKGINKNAIVGIMVERSLEMIVGMLGILKAGGAYLPIDPDYPTDRIEYMLTDSKSTVLLTKNELIKEIQFNGEIIDIEDEIIQNQNIDNLEEFNSSEDLAYIMYTSGSTGKPKGTLIMHYNVTRVVKDTNYIDITEKDNIMQLSNYSFDGSTFDIYGALLNGAKLVLLKKEKLLVLNDLANLIIDEDISIFFITTALFNALVDTKIECLKNVRKILFGGQRISLAHAKKALEYIGKDKLIHVYGPTESTVFATYYYINDIDNKAVTVPIGRPISNTKTYILDNNNKLLPIGVVGELCIAGDGLGIGYLNNTELTSEKFVKNPFHIDERMYRTGDLAKWLPDGNIEFVGRIDNQVKIRGFRIELGEIENQLLKFTSVREAIVIDRNDEYNNQYLCAYIVAEKELNVKELREYLSKELPNYMIPSYFMQLDKMPLTTNGKVEKKALPEPDGSINTGEEYEGARNNVEQILVQVWQEVLGVNKIGINDNFFELGGDSIKAIRVIAKLKKYNYNLEVKELFKHSNIKELSNKVTIGNKEKSINQAMVKGEIELIPIQKWFFEKNFTDMHHWNQSVMLFNKHGFHEDIITKVFSKIVEHHDALRMVYRKENNEIIQINRGLEGELFTLKVFDYVETENYTEEIKMECNKLQSSIDLSAGPLVKVGLFKTKDGDHLLIAIHHLVIDGVSWRILFEDFTIGYNQVLRNEEIVFQEKTNSYADWANLLKKYAQSGELLKEAKYWNKLEEYEIEKLVKDKIAYKQNNILKNCKDVSVTLSKEYTESLLKHVNRAYNTEINDILLTALGLTMKEYFGQDNILINLESHGREPVVGDIDISRTMGWFTTQYPVILDVTNSKDTGYLIKNTKEILRRIPNKGIGFGLLKQMTEGKINKSLEPEISFNYLGQFDQDIKSDIFDISQLTAGSSVSLNSEHQYTLNINGMVRNNELSITFTYNGNEYYEHTITEIGEIYKTNLCKIINHCKSQKEIQLTPTDLGDSTLTLEELDGLLNKYENDKKLKIKNIYPLSPMQEGMLFHGLMNKASTAYFEQAILTLKGDLNLDLFEKSFNWLINRYDILRTVFIHDEVKEPRQVVFKERKTDVVYKDISNLNCEEKDRYLETFAKEDKAQGFKLSEDLLMRMSVIKVSSNEYKVFWDFHHILMDGWCLGIIMNDFFKAYNLFKNNKPLELIEPPVYINYISWLQKQDKEEAEKYWLSYLDGYDNKAAVPKKNNNLIEKAYDLKEVSFKIEEQLTKELEAVGKSAQVTINTIIQAVWGILLQKYNNTKDVVFGSVVSGRNADVEGIESMVGLFINTIPVRVQCEDNITFTNLIMELQNKAVSSTKYDYYPLAEIQSKTSVKNELIDNIIIFENYHSEDDLNSINLKNDNGFVVEDVYIKEQTSYDFNLTVSPGAELGINLEYNSTVYDEEFINTIRKHLKVIIKSIVNNPQIKLSEIDILTENEKNKLLYDFNNTKVEYPKNKTIHQIFEEQVEKTPNNIAVIFEDKKMTYKELNERSNCLARTLRQKGVKPDSIVAIMVESSLELIVGLMGILKSGGAYLPIDVKYPQERIKAIIDDSNAKILLTQNRYEQNVIFDGEIINLDDDKVYIDNNEKLEDINTSQDLAYVIYTSGSTGKPKGVMIEHRNVVAYVHAFLHEYNLNEKDTVLQQATYCFDAFIEEVFPILTIGGKIVMVKKYDALDVEKLEQIVYKNQINVISCSPLFLKELNQCNNLKSVHTFISGGDVIKQEYMDNIIKYAKVYNTYGPTEATVCASYYRCKENSELNIPIGKPIANYKLYVLDNYNKMLPIGIPGELYISGDGLARGYLNNSELSAEKFVENPFMLGQKMYKTGDLVRWLPDGNIEFLGRMDHQVKIRGFRIEFGEIENQLLTYEGMKDTVVIDRQDKNGSKYLCAYVIGDKEISQKELKGYLVKKLPDFMIPSYFMQLDKMPLTLSGKLDRKALPEPDGNVNIVVTYEEPRNDKEERLVEVWQEVLGLSKVGISDNFFDLGGDSIKAIRVISKLKKYGYNLEIKELFKYQNIKNISEKITLNKNKVISQGVVKGEIELIPIQKWFFENNFTDMHHWNQSVMLFNKHGFDEKIVEKVFNKIVEHHDALRMIYKIENEEIIQYNQGVEGELFTLNTFDYTEKEKYKELIEEECNKLQSDINLNKGPLVKLGLFKTSHGDHLLIAIHHLVIDGISWRILFEDFSIGYRQVLDGEYIVFQEKTNSYLDWAKHLKSYSNNKEIMKEAKYWQNMDGDEVPALKKDNIIDKEKNILKYCKNINMILSEEYTESLLKHVNRAYNTQINDILLTALGLTIRELTGEDKVLINLEGHGREKLTNEIDISRTIGWFTTEHPVILNMRKFEDIGYVIKNTKETLKHVPNNGIGYGLLRYMSNEKIERTLNQDIIFNYLGQFDEDINNDVFEMSHISTGNSTSLNSENIYALNINGMVSGNKLNMIFTYNEYEYEESSIIKISEIYKKNLCTVIDHCKEQQETHLTPTDLGDSKLTVDELEVLTKKFENEKKLKIKNIYKLSPMQEGMLFNSLMNKDSTAYFEQTVLVLTGDLDLQIFEQSFNRLIDRYDILKTVFVYEEVKESRQIVFKERKTNIYFEDISNLRYEDIDKYCEDFAKKDKTKGFNLSKDLLIRISILKISDNKYKVFWSSHHILMDGWCNGIIISDFFKIYTSLRNQSELELLNPPLYMNYINWLEKQDKEEAEIYWTNYLKDYETKADIPRKNNNFDEGAYESKKISFTLNKKLVSELENICNLSKVTLNIVMQGIWGILLQKYNNTNDVVFGAVVSGRNAEVKDIESMVGLFINTIPVRIKNNEDTNFVSLVSQLQENALLSSKCDYYPLAEIQSKTNLKQELISNIMVYENYYYDKGLNTSNYKDVIGFSVENEETYSQTNYDFNIMVCPEEELTITLTYNSNIYDDNFINSISTHFNNVIKTIINNPKIKLSEIDIVTEVEREKVLYDFNKTEKSYVKSKTINQLFEEQVERVPDRTAVVFEDKKLTYRELNERANQLATILRNKGVKADSVVGIMVERSVEMIIGIMGILKAGGAYLPIDPEYPVDRIKFMLDDSKANILLVKDHFNNSVGFDGEIVDIGSNEIFIGKSQNLENINKPQDLAYIIYTSGSTGKPKGVMVQHDSVTNIMFTLQEYYPLTENDAYLLKTNYTFDVSVSEILGWFLGGSKLVILPKGKEKEVKDIIKTINTYKVTHINFTPSMLRIFINFIEDEGKELNSLKYIFAAGEAIQRDIVKGVNKVLSSVKLENLYGPTEATIYATKYSINNLNNTIVPIGKPVNNGECFIVDKYNNLMPIGVIGELCIGGLGLARGYLNRPKLTEERFINNPFRTGQRMYKTGDLARWLSDGNIEFLGRIDNQVKIRGFRIELGEIENQLLKHENIKEAVIVDKNDENNNKYLCAYIEADKELNISELREYLAKELPEYMIPSYFMCIDKMPLTPSGKIDKKSLPELNGNINTGSKYEEARNEVEEKLVETWQNVLGIKVVGINDNFLELGGDSIKAIRVIASMKKYGYNLEVKDIFKYLNIKDISSRVTTIGEIKVISQDVIKGEVELLPIQKWFFEKEFTEMHHWNQSVMLLNKQGFDKDIIEKVFNKIIEHHDALRMIYNKKDNKIIQFNRDIEGQLFDLKMFDYTEKENCIEEISHECNKIQSSINLSTGPLVKLGLFKTKEGDHLLIAIHHLVIDGISWRILFEDFTIGYKQLLDGEVISFQEKTNSYADWSNYLKNYAESESLLKEIDYWTGLENTKVKALIKDNLVCKEKNILQYASEENMTLSKEYTEQLLKNVNKAYNTEINDILLVSLGLAIKEWCGENNVLINMEGHGREELTDEIDISRTIGWFTTQYPVILNMSETEEIAYTIKNTKEMLRHIPNKGIGYGILTYIAEGKIRNNLKPEISFNYLGEFDQDVKSDIFEVSYLQAGNNLSLSGENLYPININAMIIEGKLNMSFTYNRYEYNESTIMRLSEIYKENLLSIIEHCLNKKETEFTPSDLINNKITMEELESYQEVAAEFDDEDDFFNDIDI